MKQIEAERLERFGSLLRRYSRALDLLSPAALASLEDKLGEALAYAEAIDELSGPAEPVLDLGSGAGLPGIPLAIVFPQRPVYLVERRQRRASFLRIAVAQLDLRAARVLCADVRDLGRETLPGAVSVVTAQAVASFGDVYCLTRHFHAPEVLILARKGESWELEAEALARRLGAAVSPAWDRPLGTRGRLVGLRVAGGLACRS